MTLTDQTVNCETVKIQIVSLITEIIPYLVRHIRIKHKCKL